MLDQFLRCALRCGCQQLADGVLSEQLTLPFQTIVEAGVLSRLRICPIYLCCARLLHQAIQSLIQVHPQGPTPAGWV